MSGLYSNRFLKLNKRIQNFCNKIIIEIKSSLNSESTKEKLRRQNLVSTCSTNTKLNTSEIVGKGVLAHNSSEYTAFQFIDQWLAIIVSSLEFGAFLSPRLHPARSFLPGGALPRMSIPPLLPPAPLLALSLDANYLLAGKTPFAHPISLAESLAVEWSRNCDIPRERGAETIRLPNLRL